MTGPEVMDVARDAIETLLLVASPLMLVGLVVGVAISLLQALTQIQETTLVFVPKILAIFLALLREGWHPLITSAPPYFATMLTSRPFTTITLMISLPSMAALTFSSASACSRT